MNWRGRTRSTTAGVCGCGVAAVYHKRVYIPPPIPPPYSEDTHLRDHETSGGFAFPTPPLSNPPTRPTSPPSSRPSTLHDLHLMAAASQAASEVASLPGDGFIHSHNGTPRDMEDGGTTVVEEEEVEEDAAAFWQHCVLVALYNICLDDDACQEVGPDTQCPPLHSLLHPLLHPQHRHSCKVMVPSCCSNACTNLCPTVRSASPTLWLHLQ